MTITKKGLISFLVLFPFNLLGKVLYFKNHQNSTQFNHVINNEKLVNLKRKNKTAFGSSHGF